MVRWILLAALVLSACTTGAPSVVPGDSLRVERVVFLMRHGVRAPEPAGVAPEGTTSERWPDWPVAAGWLTEHGVQAIRLVGSYDRATFVRLGLLAATACPEPGEVVIVSNSLQRTIVTGETYAEALAPGCGLSVGHRPQGEADPLFPWGFEKRPDYDPGKANAAVEAAIGPGGIAAFSAPLQPALIRLDEVLCGASPPKDCGVRGKPTLFKPATSGHKPAITGALGAAIQPGLALYMEYAEGWQRERVGWGRATPADISAFSRLYTEYFRIMLRPRYIAALNLSAIVPRMTNTVSDPGERAAKITIIVGHDGNIASLAGLLDLHWRADGMADDYPMPGGALGFERLIDGDGHVYVRAVFRGQSLEQMRQLSPLEAGTLEQVLPIPGCEAHNIPGLCTLTDFQRKMDDAMAR